MGTNLSWFLNRRKIVINLHRQRSMENSSDGKGLMSGKLKSRVSLKRKNKWLTTQLWSRRESSDSVCCMTWVSWRFSSREQSTSCQLRKRGWVLSRSRPSKRIWWRDRSMGLFLVSRISLVTWLPNNWLLRWSWKTQKRLIKYWCGSLWDSRLILVRCRAK